MKENLPEITGGLVGDVFSALAKDVPGGNTLGALAGGLFKRLIQHRDEQARKILLDEIADAKRPFRDVHEADAFVAILYRYLDAARQGAAHLNLRLMSKILRGQFEGDQLYADEFLRHAELLSTLSREEVIFLATLHRISLTIKDAVGDKRDAREYAVYVDTLNELAQGRDERREEFRAVSSALLRTGLVRLMRNPSMDAVGHEVMFIAPTLQLSKLIELASFEDALRQERAEGVQK